MFFIKSYARFFMTRFCFNKIVSNMWEQNCYVDNNYEMLKGLWGYIEFNIEQTENKKSSLR